MICEFQKQHELDYAVKTAAVLEQVADRRKLRTRTMSGRHLTIQLTTFRRHETTMDVTILKKRTTTRTRSMGRVPACCMKDEVVIHTCYGWHVAAGMQDEVVIHACYG